MSDSLFDSRIFCVKIKVFYYAWKTFVKNQKITIHIVGLKNALIGKEGGWAFETPK